MMISCIYCQNVVQRVSLRRYENYGSNGITLATKYSHGIHTFDLDDVPDNMHNLILVS